MDFKMSSAKWWSFWLGLNVNSAFDIGAWDPFYFLHKLTSIPAWISNHMPSKARGDITYPFPKFNSVTVEVWEWISNFIPHFIMDVITYECCDQS